MAKLCTGCSRKLANAKSNPDYYDGVNWWHIKCYKFQQRMKTHGDAFRTKQR